jgi:hypothetical protein
MSFNSKITSQRGSAQVAFHAARYQAQLVQLIERPFRHIKPLANFKSLPGILQGERTYLGFCEIPLEHITGSVRRNGDFDRHFRPLRKQLAARWVSIYRRVQAGEWAPVKLYKYGEDYYVEDGHYRLSVAGVVGMCCIQAEVWEITPRSSPARSLPPKTLRARTPASCCEEQVVRA